MSMMRRIRRTALVAAIGAASAYFLDPAEGEARRRAVTDRLRGAARLAADSAGRDVTLGGTGPDPMGGSDELRSTGSPAGAGSPVGGHAAPRSAPMGSAGGPDVVVPPAPAPELADGPGHGGAPLPPIAG